LARGGMEARLRSYYQEKQRGVPATRGALVRAILESIAASYRRTLDEVERVAACPPIRTLHLFGGGAQNRLLCELTAQKCGRDVVGGPVEATALGNLLLQARTMGDLPPGLT